MTERKGGKRSATRLAAVQALYQMEMQQGDDVEAVILEFLTHRPGAIVRDEQVLMPHHDTIIEENDHVILFLTDRSQVETVEKLFQVDATFV